MAGMAGFGPTNDGVKVRCLTAWLHPNIQLPFFCANERADNKKNRKIS